MDIKDMDHFKGIEASHQAHAATLPSREALAAASSSLPSPSSPDFLQPHDPASTIAHITNDIIPALTGQSRSSRYFGFITGGIQPIAEWADNVVTRVDQNVQVHLPAQTVATAVEDAALKMLAELLCLAEGDWKGRTFTTGATASNILGLACGRETIIGSRIAAGEGTVGDLGLFRACRLAGVDNIQVLTSAGHSCLSKAASIVGLGRGAVIELPVSAAEPWKLDLGAVEELLKKPRVASIIAVSAGEVNTGRYGIGGLEEMRKLRALADQYKAWIHADGAFGIFARALDKSPEFETLHKRIEGIELVDSITIDGHKLLNVPYDCGVFYTRTASTLQSVFTNPNAAYLTSGSQDSIPSPLNIGIENSRRWRALPAYAVLHTKGRQGIAESLARMTRLARGVAKFLRSSSEYELLPATDAGAADVDDEVFIIVLFRAKRADLNGVLVEKINESRDMYVSGTSWQGEKAARIAVSNWKVDPEQDLEVIKKVLQDVAAAV
ncbi:pyridoxal-dependent decarboxylase conserved domain-containing protein [Sarocladium implicatum]|nr:pyridoxal-dependent decarboxylase conserved domain-containing protein [Sarocladium implicatum]